MKANITKFLSINPLNNITVFNEYDENNLPEAFMYASALKTIRKYLKETNKDIKKLQTNFKNYNEEQQDAILDEL
jgi:hypothetical protein